MFKKNKLKGSKIYIENDLTWEERRIQEKIKEWARQRRRASKRRANKDRHRKGMDREEVEILE